MTRDSHRRVVEEADAADLAMIEAWRKEALLTPPDPKAWALLVAALKWGAEQERRGDHDPDCSVDSDNPMRAVVAVIDFLQSNEVTKRERLQVPFIKIYAAFVDLAKGRTPELFTTVIPPKYRQDTLTTNMHGMAAKALDELIGAGVDADEAARRVLSAMRQGRVKGHTKYTPETIKNWRYRLKEGEGAMHPSAFDRFNAPFPPEAGQTHDQRAAYLLDALRYSSAFR